MSSSYIYFYHNNNKVSVDQFINALGGAIIEVAVKAVVNKVHEFESEISEHGGRIDIIYTTDGIRVEPRNMSEDFNNRLERALSQLA